MNEPKKVSVPVWFWAVAGFALLWNLIGCAMFLGEVFAKESMIASMTDEQKAFARSTPAWIYAVFAVAVSTGLAGSICLLLRKPIAVVLFGVGLVAVLIQMGYMLLVAGGLKVLGPEGAVMPAIVVSLAAVWLVFSLFAKKKAWI